MLCTGRDWGILYLSKVHNVIKNMILFLIKMLLLPTDSTKDTAQTDEEEMMDVVWSQCGYSSPQLIQRGRNISTSVWIWAWEIWVSQSDIFVTESNAKVFVILQKISPFFFFCFVQFL